MSYHDLNYLITRYEPLLTIYQRTREEFDKIVLLDCPQLYELHRPLLRRLMVKKRTLISYDITCMIFSETFGDLSLPGKIILH